MVISSIVYFNKNYRRGCYNFSLKCNSFFHYRVLKLKEIFIERRRNPMVAIKNNDRLSDCFIEEKHGPFPGQIYKAVVKNTIPALKVPFRYRFRETPISILKVNLKRNIKKGQS